MFNNININNNNNNNNTVYIGLFDRSLLPMSLIQVESALKQATSKSRTPVSMYQFEPICIVYEK